MRSKINKRYGGSVGGKQTKRKSHKYLGKKYRATKRAHRRRHKRVKSIRAKSRRQTRIMRGGDDAEENALADWGEHGAQLLRVFRQHGIRPGTQEWHTAAAWWVLLGEEAQKTLLLQTRVAGPLTRRAVRRVLARAVDDSAIENARGRLEARESNVGISVRPESLMTPVLVAETAEAARDAAQALMVLRASDMHTQNVINQAEYENMIIRDATFHAQMAADTEDYNENN